MLTKEFTITLDMKRQLAFHPFEVVEGDTGNVLTIHLENDGIAMDLTGCDLCILFASSRGFAMQDLRSGVALGPDAGVVQATLYPDSFGAGDVRAEVQVYSGTEKKTLVTSKTFTFRCRTSLLAEEILRASATYPPLVTATKNANDAAAEARAAIAEFADLVQADWTEEDDAEPSYIQHKPASFAPAAHAASHGDGGNDPVTPAAHASRHAAGGADALTGYEPQRLQFTDVSVPVASFVSDTTYEDFPYRAAIALTGVLENMTPEVVFGAEDAMSGAFAPVAACCAGGVFIYAAEAPTEAVVIPTMICWKAVA